MAMRCYWCDNDGFSMVVKGEIKSPDKVKEAEKIDDFVCDWCGHLISEGNPRAGDPKETVESLKEEINDLRVELAKKSIEPVLGGSMLGDTNERS